jgi:CRISPR system Cascade subunit CasE
MIQMQADQHRLYQWASQEGLNTEDAGYLVHAAMRAALGQASPQPFSLQPGGTRGQLSILGYSPFPREYVLGQRQAYASPLLAEAFPEEEILAKAMPERWPGGREFRFSLTACPVRRQTTVKDGRRKTTEKDAFLVACDHQAPEDPPLERAPVYLGWLKDELARNQAAELVRARLTGFQLVRLVRRSRRPGKAVRLPGQGQRPQASFEGRLRVESGLAFGELLARGVGRHRAFGYGMILLKAV